MLQSYLDTIHLIERLHRQFLEVVKVELDRLKVDDINNVQALVLFNIGKDQMTVGELTQRGYYLGSNVSYNVKKMTENEYILQEPSPHDKRSIRIRLSPKGLTLWDKINQMFVNQSQMLAQGIATQADLAGANKISQKLEKFWQDILSKAGVKLFEG